MQRKLPTASVITRDSLIVREKPQFAISLLKNKLRQLFVSLLSEEENVAVSQSESGSLIFEKIEETSNEEVIPIINLGHCALYLQVRDISVRNVESESKAESGFGQQ